MLSTFVYRSRLASAVLISIRSSRYISSLSHLTPWERRLYVENLEAKARLLPCPISQRLPALRSLRPQIYQPQSSSWDALEGSNQGLERGSVLRIVSWNIDWSRPDPAARASAIIGYLEGLCGEASGPLVVMFQEVCRQSLQVILESSWVQGNFVLSNSEPPESLYTDIPGESFVLKQLDWDAAPYFTLTMVSRHLAVKDCFRVPLITRMGRDALVVDISVFNPERPRQPEESLRLCTTHLESLWGGKAYHHGQLALVSTLLKGTPTEGSKIIAGLVGGDMNAIDRAEHELHKASDVNLRDVWEDIPPPPIPALKPGQKDFSYGRARGNTWGYQSNGKREKKRLDKFFYTGSLETISSMKSKI
ncbi:MAG: hypothetical protein LQ338_007835 [Usnochroma carphineum]|nr:MAG: hypothetical protein LQ338_007835 [Usnochroma carphineum]